MTDEPAEPGLIKPALITIGGVALCGLLGAGFVAMGHRLDAVDAGPWAVAGWIVGYVALIMAIIFTTLHIARRASGVRRLTGAAKRYNRRFSVAIGLYAVTLAGSLITWNLARPAGLPTMLLLALVPALPLLAVIWLIGVYLREEEDEFIRAVMNQSALLASGGVLAVATVWGFCEMFRIAPHAPAWIAFPLWCLLFGTAQPIIRLRYR